MILTDVEKQIVADVVYKWWKELGYNNFLHTIMYANLPKLTIYLNVKETITDLRYKTEPNGLSHIVINRKFFKNVRVNLDDEGAWWDYIRQNLSTLHNETEASKEKKRKAKDLAAEKRNKLLNKLSKRFE